MTSTGKDAAKRMTAATGPGSVYARCSDTNGCVVAPPVTTYAGAGSAPLYLLNGQDVQYTVGGGATADLGVPRFTAGAGTVRVSDAGGVDVYANSPSAFPTATIACAANKGGTQFVCDTPVYAPAGSADAAFTQGFYLMPVPPPPSITVDGWGGSGVGDNFPGFGTTTRLVHPVKDPKGAAALAGYGPSGGGTDGGTTVPSEGADQRKGAPILVPATPDVFGPFPCNLTANVGQVNLGPNACNIARMTRNIQADPNANTRWM